MKLIIAAAVIAAASVGLAVFHAYTQEHPEN